MPKPLLLRRPSGLYARFLLPSDMCTEVGARFFVRSLGNERGDMARLTAARMGYALAQAIAVVRSQGLESMDTKKLMDGALAAAARLGRAVRLFAGSETTGQRAANIISLIQSAKANGHDPHAYLRDVLTRLPTHKNNRIGELLPHTWKPTNT